MSENNTQPTQDDPIDKDIMDDVASDEIESDDIEPSEPEDEESSPTEDATTPHSTDELDIDAALAAVSQLSLLAEDEPDDDIVDAAYQPIDDQPEDSDTDLESNFELPRSLTMSRGQLASVIPALALIVIGGWLTFTLTTSNVVPSAGLLLAVVLIAIGVVFLSQWLSSARWSRGNFFIGISTLLIGGIQLYLTQVAPDTLNSGWSLWIVAVGIALFGAGYLTVPRLPRLSIMGLVVIVAGGIGYLLTSGTIEAPVINFLSNLWFVGVAIIVFMLVAPLIRRRQ